MRRAVLGVASFLFFVAGVGVAEPTRAPAKPPSAKFTKDRGVAARAKKVKELLAEPAAKVLALAKADSRYAGARQALTEADGAQSDVDRRTKRAAVASTASAIRTDAVGKARVNLPELESKLRAVYQLSTYTPPLLANVGNFTPTINSGSWGDRDCGGPDATGPLAFQTVGSGDDTCVSERMLSASYQISGTTGSRFEVTVEGSVSTVSTIVAFGVGGFSMVELGMRVLATTQTPYGGQNTWAGEASCLGWITGHAAASANYTIEQKVTDEPITLKCGVDLGTNNALYLSAEIFNRVTLITDLGSSANVSSNFKVNNITFTTK